MGLRWDSRGYKKPPIDANLEDYKVDLNPTLDVHKLEFGNAGTATKTRSLNSGITEVNSGWAEDF